MNPLDAPNQLTIDPEHTDDAVRSRSLYRTMWRWHFFAGVFALPVIVLLCLTGLVMLFKPQLWDLQYGHLQTVAPADQTVSYSRQLDAVQQRYPDAHVTAVHTPPDASRSTIVNLTTRDGHALSAYVDPYRATVLGHRDNTTDPVAVALELHGSLMTGRWLGSEIWGDGFIETVAGWGLVLLVTGVYLWWPRGERPGLRGVLVPRLGALRGRTGWRDIHAVTGVLFGFVVFFFLITGMAWTGVWGPKYLAPAADPAAHHHDALPWHPSAGAPLDAVVAAGHGLGIPHGFSVAFPENASGSYAVNYWEDGPQQPNRSTTDTRVAYIDQYTAQPISQYGFADYGWAAKATSYGIALHEGREWGLVNQILTTIGVTAVLVLLASSVVMWRKRRPQGLGAPARVPARKLGAGLVIAIVALGLLFPLLGASMLVVALVEFLVVRRVPALARALGAS